MEMDDKSINDKHSRIRGSDDLKYPGNQSRCRSTCGHYHDEYHDHEGHLKYKEHRCFLAIGHREEFCEFSSVCSEKRVRPSGIEPTLGADGRYCTHHDDDPAHTTECYKPQPDEADNTRFAAYNQAVEDALAAVREESRFTDGAASFINAIARHCSPHRYVASLAARPRAHQASDPYRPICRHCGLADIAGDWDKYPCNDAWRKQIATNY